MIGERAPHDCIDVRPTQAVGERVSRIDSDGVRRVSACVRARVADRTIEVVALVQPGVAGSQGQPGQVDRANVRTEDHGDARSTVQPDPSVARQAPHHLVHHQATCHRDASVSQRAAAAFWSAGAIPVLPTDSWDDAGCSPTRYRRLHAGASTTHSVAGTDSARLHRRLTMAMGVLGGGFCIRPRRPAADLGNAQPFPGAGRYSATGGRRGGVRTRGVTARASTTTATSRGFARCRSDSVTRSVSRRRSTGSTRRFARSKTLMKP